MEHITTGMLARRTQDQLSYIDKNFSSGENFLKEHAIVNEIQVKLEEVLQKNMSSVVPLLSREPAHISLFEDETYTSENFRESYAKSKDELDSILTQTFEKLTIEESKRLYHEKIFGLFTANVRIALREKLAKNFTLRPHQQNALLHLRHAVFEENHKKVLVQMPTGTGKTVLFSYMPDALGITKKTLVLSHRKQLFEQTQQKLELIHPEKKISIEAGNKKSDNSADMIVASVATLGKKNSDGRSDEIIELEYEQNPQMTYVRDFDEYAKRLTQLDPTEYGLIVIDEAHHAPAESYQRILDYFYSSNPNIILVGVTATPLREDDLKLEDVFDVLAYSMTLSEAIEKNLLAEIECYRVETNVSLDDVHSSKKDFIKSELSKVLDTPYRNNLIFDKLEEYGKNPDGSLKRTMIFATDVEHSKNIEKVGKARGHAICHIDAKTPDGVRDESLAAIKRGELPVICNCGVFTEGTDIEELEIVVMARATKSATLYEQMIGRGTRRIKGKKEKMILIDMVDSTKKHKVMDVAKLFGLPPEKAHGNIIEQVREYAEERLREKKPRKVTLDGHGKEDQRYRMFTVPEEIKNSRILFHAEHEFARVYLSKGMYIEVAKTALMGSWKCYFPSVPGKCEAQDKIYSNLTSAIADVERFLVKEFANEQYLWNKYANSQWAKDDATDKQMDALYWIIARNATTETLDHLKKNFPYISFSHCTKFIKSFHAAKKANRQDDMQKYMNNVKELGINKGTALLIISASNHRRDMEKEKSAKYDEIEELRCYSEVLSLYKKLWPKVGDEIDLAQLELLSLERLQHMRRGIEKERYATDGAFESLQNSIQDLKASGVDANWIKEYEDELSGICMVDGKMKKRIITVERAREIAEIFLLKRQSRDTQQRIKNMVSVLVEKASIQQVEKKETALTTQFRNYTKFLVGEVAAKGYISMQDKVLFCKEISGAFVYTEVKKIFDIMHYHLKKNGEWDQYKKKK